MIYLKGHQAESMTHFVAAFQGLAGAQWVAALGWFFVLLILAACLRFYGRLFGRVLAGEGKVWAQPFGIPDVMIVVVLGTWLGGLAVRGFIEPVESRPMTSSEILQSALLFGIIVAGLLFFLNSRKVPVVRLFGFGQVRFFRALGLAVGLLVAAYPLIFLCTELMIQWLGDGAESQKIVEFFSEAARGADFWKVAATASVGVLVAPLAEEILFRGYIYGVLRRYLGPVAALFLSAALFAAIHVNLLALPSLFVLAICFTLAYEISGSLLVPMMMHAMFNAVTLGKVFFDAYMQR